MPPGRPPRFPGSLARLLAGQPAGLGLLSAAAPLAGPPQGQLLRPQVSHCFLDSPGPGVLARPRGPRESRGGPGSWLGDPGGCIERNMGCRVLIPPPQLPQAVCGVLGPRPLKERGVCRRGWRRGVFAWSPPGPLQLSATLPLFPYRCCRLSDFWELVPPPPPGPWALLLG